MERRKQIKSKKRVRDHGEVFTADREVNAMLDLVQSECERIESRFLEPACGNGNFLVEILRRKLRTVESLYSNDIDEYKIHMIQAVTSIYGVDIQQDNVDESKVRMLSICNNEFNRLFNADLTDGMIRALNCVMDRNIICGNTLTGLFSDGSPMKFSEWNLNEQGMFERKDYYFSDMLNENSSSVKTRTIIHNFREAA